MLEPEALSVVLGLAAAALFGTSGMIARLGLYHADARVGSLLSIASTAGLCWLLSPWLLESALLDAAQPLMFVAVFAAVGLLSPGLSLLLAFEGSARLGATVSGTIASVAPLFATAGAVLLLGERPTQAVLLGTVAVVGGVITLSWRNLGGRHMKSPWWTLGFPLGAAVIRAAAQMTAKYGMAVALAPFSATLINFTMSLCLVLPLHYTTGGAPLSSASRRGKMWFLLTGLLNGAALILMYRALGLGKIIVVSPIVSTYPVFTMVMSMIVGTERLGLRGLLGVSLVVCGVAAISTQ